MKFVLLVTVFIAAASAIFVGPDGSGNDNIGCGIQMGAACATINFALTESSELTLLSGTHTLSANLPQVADLDVRGASGDAADVVIDCDQFSGFETNTTLTLRDFSMQNCNTTDNGAAARMSSGEYSFDISNCAFSNSESTNGNGGALYLRGYNSRLEDVTVTGSSADFNGGGIFVWGANGTFARIDISECYANSNGGGLYLWQTPETVEDLIVVDCEARLNGGGLYCQSEACAVSGNTKIYGNICGSNAAGVYASQGVDFDSNTVIIRGNTGGDNIFAGFDNPACTICDLGRCDLSGASPNPSTNCTCDPNVEVTGDGCVGSCLDSTFSEDSATCVCDSGFTETLEGLCEADDGAGVMGALPSFTTGLVLSVAAVLISALVV